MVSVGSVIRPAARGLGQTVEAFLRDLVEWQRPADGGERQPSSNTIRRYATNMSTRCSFRFAELVMEYLWAKPDVGISDREQLLRAKNRCRAVLLEDVERRFTRRIGSDPALHVAEGRYAGAYAVCRKETADNKYHQELLLLERYGEKEPRRPVASYVAANFVFRGEWCLIGNSLCITVMGFRGKDRTHDVVDLLIATEKIADDVVMGGFLAGVTTAAKYPVVMPIIIAKIHPIDEEILSLAHGSDAEAQARFNAALGNNENIMSAHIDLLDDIERRIFPRKIIGAGELTSIIRERKISSKMLILPDLAAFCASPRSKRPIARKGK